MLTGFSFLGSLIALSFSGRLVDRMGSVFVQNAAVAGFSLMIAGWFLLAAGILPAGFAVPAALNIFGGATGSLLGVANGRLVFATMPLLGRNHFFALFTVITNLGLGATPVCFGIVLDYIGTFEAVTGAFHWKRHSIYFAVLFALCSGSLLLSRRLKKHPED